MDTYRSPDPETAELARLFALIAELNVELERARQTYAAVAERRRATIDRYNALVLARSRRPVPAAPAPPPPSPGVTPPLPGRPEASTRTVQNILFVLGGLLLGSAAIVFTAVAWANVGVLGRAVILAVVTLLTLAVPPLALRRRLTGTAETFAALGLLLVLLDGYAVWAVNLFDVTHTLPPARYAAAVGATTAAVALGYRWLTGLSGPGYAALALAQPVPLLALTGTGLGPAGWSVAATGLALADLLVVRLRPLVIQVMAWAFAIFAAVLGFGLAAGGLVGTQLTGAVRAAGALVLLAAVPVGAALVARRQVWLRHLAGAGVVGALALAGGRIFALAYPGARLAPVAVELVAIALTIHLVPAGLRLGPRIAALVATGFVALVPVAGALLATGRTVPVAWTHDRTPTATHLDLALPLTLALLALAAGVLVPGPVRIGPAVAGAVLVALAVPVAVPLAWWGPSIVDGVAAVPLAVGAARIRRWSVVAGGGALLLTGHAVVVGLGAPGTTAAVLAAVLGLAAGTAALARGSATVRAVAAGIALAVPPGLAAAVAAAYGAGVAPYAAAGLVASTGTVLALRRRVGSAALAVPLAGFGVLWAVRSDGWYLGLPALCDALVAAAVATAGAARRRQPYLVLGALAAVPPVVAGLAVAYALLVEPYRAVFHVWAGVPARLVVPGAGPVALTQALLATGVYAGVRRLPWVAVPASVALIAGTAAVHPTWPVPAALTLAVGLGTGLWAALRPVPWLGVLTAVATGAGLAGLLPTRSTTLVGLGAVLVTAVVAASAGRPAGTRIAAWVTAVASGELLAFATARSLDLPLRVAAFWVLGSAALALGLSGRLRGTAGRAVEASAHGAALVALLLCAGTGRYPAAVLALWGVAVGLRALWPGEPGRARQVRVVAGTGCELLAYWLVLWIGGVGVAEAYTVPAAVLALIAGLLATRTRPELRSWTAYGPALLAGFGPSLALALVEPDAPLRRLALGAAGVAVVVLGAAYRRQAPVVVAGTTLALLALHEAVLLWDLLPRWIPLGVAGFVLVGLAITYERRRRDLGRLRGAIGRMS